MAVVCIQSTIKNKSVILSFFSRGFLDTCLLVTHPIYPRHTFLSFYFSFPKRVVVTATVWQQMNRTRWSTDCGGGDQHEEKKFLYRDTFFFLLL